MRASTARQSITFPSRTSTPASREISHESIAADVEAFERSGGEIEVLGNTPMLKHIGLAADTAKDSPSGKSDFLQTE